MSILIDLVKELQENAAGGAGGAGGVTAGADVASAPESLFGGGVISRVGTKKRKNSGSVAPKIMRLNNRNRWKWRALGEALADGEQQTFDLADVTSKLDAAERRVRSEEDTIPFGLEDDEGNVIKVYVQADQADEFEAALGTLLAGGDQNNDEEYQPVEIAEILFKLKDSFTIVDVVWPEIEGDEEEEQEVAPGEGEAPPEGEGEMPPEGGAGEELDDLEGEAPPEGEGEMPPEGEMNMEPEMGPENALQQVIDMLKADAEAKKAEASAREAEARAKEAEANASAAASKVKQEEDVLDMESYYKDKKSEKDEVDRLAKLAKYKHDRASEAEMNLAQEEEEENLANKRPTSSTKITTADLLGKLLDLLRSNE